MVACEARAPLGDLRPLVRAVGSADVYPDVDCYSWCSRGTLLIGTAARRPTVTDRPHVRDRRA